MGTKRKIKYGTKELERDIGRLTFGEMLRSHRLCEEIGQKEFAKILGISPSSLCDLEKGRTIPSVSRAKKIANKLQTSENFFMKIAIEDQLEREGITNVQIVFKKAA